MSVICAVVSLEEAKELYADDNVTDPYLSGLEKSISMQCDGD